VNEIDVIYNIIYDAARAYKGIIPDDCIGDPYMTMDELQHEIDCGVEFWGCEEEGILAGVMGIQNVKDVTLIRHAYIRTIKRNRGIGAELLSHLRTLTQRPILIGTWAAADWAIRFYEKHGFRPVSPAEKDRLLRTYWSISDRQVETSVVLAEQKLSDRT
jgi:N-acetylglutamate synthase-like GNAT family acetyltransferase